MFVDNADDNTGVLQPTNGPEEVLDQRLAARCREPAAEVIDNPAEGTSVKQLDHGRSARIEPVHGVGAEHAHRDLLIGCDDADRSVHIASTEGPDAHRFGIAAPSRRLPVGPCPLHAGGQTTDRDGHRGCGI